MSYFATEDEPQVPRQLGRRALSLPWFGGRKWTLRDVRLADVVDADNLVAHFKMLVTRAGQAAGPDGIRFRDVSMREAADISRFLSAQLTKGRYVALKPRPVQIPKTSGHGHRKLQIGGVFDRVIARAVQTALSTPWEAVFAGHSFGYRRNLSHMQLLAEIARRAEGDGQWVISTADLRDAFGHVLVDDVLRLHRDAGLEEPMIALVRQLLVARRRKEPIRGIAQGLACSPLFLNVVLHDAVDRRVSNATATTSWSRFADDFVIQGRRWAGVAARQRRLTDAVAKAGFTLLAEHEPVDLGRGGTARVLGFDLCQFDEQLQLRLAPSAWDRLVAGLRTAHRAPDPIPKAQRVLSGWMNAYGVAVEDERDHPRILELADQAGFRELGSWDQLELQSRQACQKWRQMVERRESQAKYGGSAMPTTEIESDELVDSAPF